MQEKELALLSDPQLRRQVTQKKINSYIGLATKAGKLAGGDFMVERMVKSGNAALVLLAEDTSENTKKKYRNMCDFYETPLYFFGTKESIGKAAGKEYRAMLAFCDRGMANAVQKQLESIKEIELENEKENS